ncbi:hypothetical protein HPB51_007828 [Rhipicephalus microplus]|uniref:Uncharacterized protein n=1 Tax=Rhipicephalus microplus TaxID=6941 RepID=A0A9J6EMB6_RHIMP|nr:hypothetical protein HPB51_007828 [Rhipicephalus microplus]
MATSKSNSERSSASHHREDCRRSVDLRQSTSQDRSSVARHLVLRDASSGCPPTLFICPVIAAAVTGAAIFLQFFKTSTDKLPKDSVTESYSRSMDVMLQMLWLTGNSTLDPCKDFYRYVCYNYIAVHKEKGFFNTIQSPHLVLQGMSNNEAGRALFAYYRSCIFSQGSPIDAVRNAVRALLQMLYVSLDSTSLRMLIFIMKLNLVYGIHTDPLVYQNFQGRRPALVNYVIDSEEMFNSLSADGPQYLFILSDEYYICADNFDNTDFEKIYTAGLTELSSAINVNITFKEIVEFATQFCSVATYDGLNEANGTILGSIVKGVSSRLWKDIVEEFTHTEVGRVILSPVDVLKHRFNLLTSRSKKPVATALGDGHLLGHHRIVSVNRCAVGDLLFGVDDDCREGAAHAVRCRVGKADAALFSAGLLEKSGSSSPSPATIVFGMDIPQYRFHGNEVVNLTGHLSHLLVHSSWRVTDLSEYMSAGLGGQKSRKLGPLLRIGNLLQRVVYS